MVFSFNFKKGYVFFILILLVGAVFKSLNAPVSSIILDESSPFVVTFLMCTGATIFGIFVALRSLKDIKKEPVRRLHKSDTPYILLIVFVETLGNLLFFSGLAISLASSASLVKCFGVVATAVIAFFILKERISKRLLGAILLVTLGCITIAAGDIDAFIASPGLLLVLGSCICSGFSYTFKKKLADRNSGLLTLATDGLALIPTAILAVCLSSAFPSVSTIIGGIVLGILVFGIPNVFYQLAARKLGASKCTTVFGLAPFIGAGISFIIFQEMPTLAFFISFVLLIPGFYLVIVDRDDMKMVNGDVPSLPPVETHHDIRNYLTAAGFLVIFVVMCIHAVSLVSAMNLETTIYGGITFQACCALAVVQLVIGCVILVLRKRDMAGIFMLFAGFSTMLLVCSSHSTSMTIIVSIMAILFALVLLLAKERKKYCYSVMLFLPSLLSISSVLFANAILNLILCLISGIYILLLAIGSSGLLPRISLTNILAEDELTDFSKVGSTLCYIIIAFSLLPWIGAYTIGMDFFSVGVLSSFTIACGIMVGIVSLLMIFIGKNSFTSIVFLCMAVFLILLGSTTGVFSYICGLLMFFTGLCCFLRKRMYIMLGVLCVLYGVSTFVLATAVGANVLIFTQFLMHIIMFILAVYMAFAVFSDGKRLPLF